MHRPRYAKPGFILPLTLMILTALTILITSVYQKVTVYIPYARALREREKAKMLALSSIEVAIQELQTILNPKKDNHKEQQDPILAQLMQKMNRWQKVPLENLFKNEDATLSFFIASNLGKINLFTIYDREKKEFRKNSTGTDFGITAQALGEWGKKMKEELPLFFEKREYEPEDCTEFLTLTALKDFREKIVPDDKAEPIFFMDLFYLDTQVSGINPLLGSASLKKVCGLTQSEQQGKDSEKELLEIIKKIDKSSSLEKIWNESLSKLYGKKWEELPEIVRKNATIQHENVGYSVTAIARVGKISQKIHALLREENEEKSKRFAIDRIYWIS